MLHPEERYGPRGLGRALQVGDKLADPVQVGNVRPGKDWIVTKLDEFWGWVDVEALG